MDCLVHIEHSAPPPLNPHGCHCPHDFEEQIVHLTHNVFVLQGSRECMGTEPPGLRNCGNNRAPEDFSGEDRHGLQYECGPEEHDKCKGHPVKDHRVLEVNSEGQ